jgi:hypothetical protein
MATGPSAKRQIHVRLIHNGVQPGTPLDEPLRFGLQDAKGEVHPGLTQPGEARNFDLILEVSEDDEADKPVLRGAFAHGPAKARFIYLSWKRQGKHEQPWGWRIKIPLSGIGWAEILLNCPSIFALMTDVEVNEQGWQWAGQRHELRSRRRPAAARQGAVSRHPAATILSPGESQPDVARLAAGEIQHLGAEHEAERP